MQGSITKFRGDLGLGVIEGINGQKYRFFSSHLFNPSEALVGLEVDFRLESRQAREIVVLHGSPWAAFGHTGAAAKRS